MAFSTTCNSACSVLHVILLVILVATLVVMILVISNVTETVILFTNVVGVYLLNIFGGCSSTPNFYLQFYANPRRVMRRPETTAICTPSTATHLGGLPFPRVSVGLNFI